MEPGGEVGEDIRVDVAERGVGAVLCFLGEGRQDLAFEVGARVGVGDRGDVGGAQRSVVDTEHVGLDARGDQRDLGAEQLGDARCGVQGDGRPDVGGRRLG